ncbi:hypothetical protein SMD11_4832 [Streptomyces albireticuli]|uniref:Secreted protein n=1 Tax=Streptomyces albireticuli TaxID=1940 RepID=A0A1Z2L807_9ACTN|nr:hypothetical protein [Streptomyces albireticuli]ARZ70425.1 hypothetical protein SMD11_4832 [Streptomyces albireticuli]
MFSRARTLLIAGTGAAAVVLGTAAPGVAAGDDTTLPSAVETFEYPGAAKIFKERGIKLERGDGHILFADCEVSEDIVVYTKPTAGPNRGKYCFRVTGSGKKGYLALDLPDAIGVGANKYDVWASVTGSGFVEVPKNKFKTVGESATGKPGSLLALQV